MEGERLARLEYIQNMHSIQFLANTFKSNSCSPEHTDRNLK